MRRLIKIVGILYLGLLVQCVAATTVHAQRGGSNGGGGNSGGVNSGGGSKRTGGRTTLIFDPAAPIGKYTPTASGSCLVSTYVTTLSIDIKVSAVDLPDNTPLTVTVYARDYFDASPWPSQIAGTMYVAGRKCSLSSSALWTTGAGLLPVITSVVVTGPDGAVIISGHP